MKNAKHVKYWGYYLKYCVAIILSPFCLGCAIGSIISLFLYGSIPSYDSSFDDMWQELFVYIASFLCFTALFIGTLSIAIKQKKYPSCCGDYIFYNKKQQENHQKKCSTCIATIKSNSKKQHETQSSATQKEKQLENFAYWQKQKRQDTIDEYDIIIDVGNKTDEFSDPSGTSSCSSCSSSCSSCSSSCSSCSSCSEY